jgi:hypothetical protein
MFGSSLRLQHAGITKPLQRPGCKKAISQPQGHNMLHLVTASQLYVAQAN